MKQLLATVACTLTLGVAAMPTLAHADQADRKTILTFNEPVEIPGRVLPAGRYQFRLVDPTGDQGVVEISSGDGRHVLATVMAIPKYRSRTPGKTIVTFKQRTAGAPAAIRAWFYPGDDDGLEFVYPKSRAVQLAQAAQEPVKATSDDMAAHMGETPAPAQAAETLKEAPVQVAQPTGEVVELEEVFTAVPALPRTASLVPAELGVGMALLALGFAINAWDRRLRQQ
jgi:hypothetical protein